jgi:hypothetical protein
MVGAFGLLGVLHYAVGTGHVADAEDHLHRHSGSAIEKPMNEPKVTM